MDEEELNIGDTLENSDVPNSQKAYDYLIEKGLPKHISAGLVGNLMQESYELERTWPDGQVDDVGSKGIMQWHGKRLQRMYEFQKDKYPNYKNGQEISLTDQLDYVLHEANTGAGDQWLKKQYDEAFSSPDTKSAATNFSNLVLRPSKKHAKNDKRVNYARTLYDTKDNTGLVDDGATYNDYNKYKAVKDNIPEVGSPLFPSKMFDEIIRGNPQEDNDIERNSPARGTVPLNGIDYSNSPEFELPEVEQVTEESTVQPRESYTDFIQNYMNNHITDKNTNQMALGGSRSSDPKKVITNKDVSESKDFLQSYHNSSKFKERFTNDFGSKSENDLNQILKDVNTNYNNSYVNLENVNSGVGSNYDDINNIINIDKNQSIRDSSRGIPAHEYSHLSERYDFLNSEDMMRKVSEKGVKSDTRSNNFSETRADVNGLRYLMNKEGINDARVQDFAKGDLENVKKKLGKDTIYKRLSENYKEEDLIWMMNNLADNSNSNTGVNMAAYGGKKTGSEFNGADEFLNEFNNGGTHEENPYGGIPLGIGANGHMDTVEEGETSFKFDDGDYIFSDRIKISEGKNKTKK